MFQKVYAPWSEDQVKCLNDYQHSPYMHPFTCPGDGREDICGEIVAHIDYDPEQPIYSRTNLVATTDGWVCPKCGNKQNWANYAATVFNEKEYLEANLDLKRFVQRTHFLVDDFLGRPTL